MCGKMPAGHGKEEGLLSRPDVSFKYLQLFLFPGESAQNEATLYHQKHMVMTLLASFFYSAHLPERLAPGCFDYIGECAAALLPLPSCLGRAPAPDTSDAVGEGRQRQGEKQFLRKVSRCKPRGVKL